LGSLLEGLDELERQQIYVVVFLAHSDQSKHEDSTARWLHNMADSLPAYPDDHQLLELIQTLEGDDNYPANARKQKIDYSVLLAEFLYLRIFYYGRLLGWNAEEWPYYVGFTSVIIFGNLALLLGLRKRFQTVREAMPIELVVILCGICTPMMIILFFAAGRSCMLPKRLGVTLMQMYGYCGQGLVFPQKQVTDNLLPLFRDTVDSHAAVDTFLEDYANANNELRWAATPNLIQHVGGKSSHGVGD
ncbi:hypothetical protein F5Y09DRAFT_353402, partial [Xylaria sp. FL1042]